MDPPIPPGDGIYLVEQVDASQILQVLVCCSWGPLGWIFWGGGHPKRGRNTRNEGETPKMREIQEDEEGMAPPIPPGDIFPSRWTWSTPPSRATGASRCTVSGERRGPPGRGFWGRSTGKRRSDGDGDVSAQARQRGGGSQRHRVPAGDGPEPGEAAEHHGQRAGDDRGGGDAVQLHRR